MNTQNSITNVNQAADASSQVPKAAASVGLTERNASAGHLDGKTFAIGILSVTACVLFVGFLMISSTPEPAYGIGQLDRGGDYIMLTQQLSESVEGILVVDAAAKAGILYSYDYNRKSIEQVSPRLRLDKLPSRDRKAVPPVKGADQGKDRKVINP